MNKFQEKEMALIDNVGKWLCELEKEIDDFATEAKVYLIQEYARRVFREMQRDEQKILWGIS